MSTLGKALAITVSAATIAALSACGSDNNAVAPTGSPGAEGAGTVDCGGQKSL